jgi:nucleotide-binding universal stress UspA family protein
MKNIVVPTDFSEDEKNTILYGIHLAKALDFDVELVHIVQPDYPGFVSMYSTAIDYREMDTGPRIADAEKRFVSLIDDLRVNFPEGPAISSTVIAGFYEQELLDLTAKEKSGMLLLTGEEQRGGGKWLLSDSNVPIVNRASVPVVIIPRGSKFETIDRIVYATDYHKQDIDSIKVLAGWARAFEARIIVVHVTDTNDFREEIETEGFRQMLADEVDYPNINVLTISSKDLEEGLNKFMADTNAKMMALLKENEGFWKNLLQGGNTRHLIFKSSKPVIIFHLK